MEPEKQQTSDMSFVEMSYRGAACFRSGNYRAAIELLAVAFKESRASIRGGPVDFPSPYDEAALDLGVISAPSAQPKDALDDLMIFRGAMFIKRNVEADENRQIRVMKSIVIVYNLALSYHLLAHQFEEQPNMKKKSQNFYFSKAAALYGMAYNLQQGQGVISMAVLNNMGQIYRHEGHRKRPSNV